MGEKPARELSSQVTDINYNKTYSNMRIKLDNKEFHNCEFLYCTILYAGGELPILSGNTFGHCTFELVGAARNTLLYLRGLYHSSGSSKDLVEGIFNSIRESQDTRYVPEG